MAYWWRGSDNATKHTAKSTICHLHSVGATAAVPRQLEHRRQSIISHANARWYVVHHADADRRPVVHDSAGRCHGNAISDTGSANDTSRYPRRGIDAIRADSDTHSDAGANEHA